MEYTAYIYSYKHNKYDNLNYIGKTINPERREKNHKSKVETGNEKFYKTVRDYGIENFTFEILETLNYKNNNNLKEMDFILECKKRVKYTENFYINKYGTLNTQINFCSTDLNINNSLKKYTNPKIPKNNRHIYSDMEDINPYIINFIKNHIIYTNNNKDFILLSNIVVKINETNNIHIDRCYPGTSQIIKKHFNCKGHENMCYGIKFVENNEEGLDFDIEDIVNDEYEPTYDIREIIETNELKNDDMEYYENVMNKFIEQIDSESDAIKILTKIKKMKTLINSFQDKLALSLSNIYSKI